MPLKLFVNVEFSTSFKEEPSSNFHIQLPQEMKNHTTGISVIQRSDANNTIVVSIGIKKEYSDYYKTNGMQVLLEYDAKYTFGRFLSLAESDNSGNFSKSYTIIISDALEELTTLTIVFDILNNRHPYSIVVDNVEYFVDDAVFTVTGLRQTGRHIIRISNWNTPKSRIIIAGIYSDLSINIDKQNIIGIETSLFDRSDLKLPSFGIISNKGNIEFNDIDREVEDYAKQGLLKEGLKCEITLHNTLVDGASTAVGVFETNKWNYDNDNKKVSVSLKDDLEEWQNINVKGLTYHSDFNERESSCSFFYEYLYNITIKNYKMKSLEELDEQTRNILNQIILKYPFIEDGTLWEQWNKLCIACQLHIFKNANGVIECKYNGGN